MPEMTKRVRELRIKLTDTEKKLWQSIRKQQIPGNKIRKQLPMQISYVLKRKSLLKSLSADRKGWRTTQDPGWIR